MMRGQGVVISVPAELEPAFAGMLRRINEGSAVVRPAPVLRVEITGVVAADLGPGMSVSIRVGGEFAATVARLRDGEAYMAALASNREAVLAEVDGFGAPILAGRTMRVGIDPVTLTAKKW